MRTLYDEKIVGEKFQYFLVFDFIKCETLLDAENRRDRLLSHNFEEWSQKDSTIKKVTSIYLEVKKDGSCVYDDISIEALE
jgi:hypothetical protein